MDCLCRCINGLLGKKIQYGEGTGPFLRSGLRIFINAVWSKRVLYQLLQTAELDSSWDAEAEHNITLTGSLQTDCLFQWFPLLVGCELATISTRRKHSRLRV
jgi:hypothetical protein